MRTSSSLLLALLPAVATASQSAAIYLQPPPPAQGPSTPSLSPFEANSVLAHYTGLSRSIFSEVVEDAVDFGRKEWDYLWRSVHPVENAVGAGRPDVVMIVMQSDYPQDFVSLPPTFTIPDAPKSVHFSELLETYLSKAHFIFDQIIASVLDIIHTPSKPASVPTYKGLLDVFDLTPSESTVLFKDELNALVGTLESEWDPEDAKFTGLRLNGLSRIALEHGRGSEVYETAAQTLKAIFSHDGMKSRKLALIVHPSDESQRLYSRADAAPIKHGVIPIYSTSQCFTTSDACTNSTNTCSGHGSCLEVTRADKTCWACACGTTSDSKGRKTTWAGQSCQKQDYSVPFVLLAGSTILLVAIAIGSVQILYSVGDVPLPNVLTSGSTSHLKRD